MKNTVEKYIGAIKQAEKNFISNAVDIGKFLYFIEQEGEVLKPVIENIFTFGYGRGIAFKNLYEDLYVHKKIPLTEFRILGVEKTIALLQPLKSQSADFLLAYPAEELKDKSLHEVREVVKSFSEAPSVKKAERYFRDAENKLFDVMGMFDGAISMKYSEEFAKWSGRKRIVAALSKLKKLVEGLR